MSRRVLVDTGPLVAMRNRRDQHRERVLTLAVELPTQLFTSWPVLTETVYLLRGQPSEIAILFEGFRSGILKLLPLDEADAVSIAAILDKYDDQSLSLADASLMHLAEREDIEEVFTVDAKDFSVFRTATGRALTVIA